MILVLTVFIVKAQEPFSHEIIQGGGLSKSDLKRNIIEGVWAYQKRDKNINKNLRNVRDLTLKYPIQAWTNGETEIIQTFYGIEIKNIVFTFTLTFEIKEGNVLVIVDNLLYTTMPLLGADFTSFSEQADMTGVILGKKGLDKNINTKIKPLIVDFLDNEFMISIRSFITKKPYKIDGWH